MTYEYIRVHTCKKVRLEEGTPGIQGKGAITQEKKEREKVDSLRILSRYEAGNYSIKRI